MSSSGPSPPPLSPAPLPLPSRAKDKRGAPWQILPVSCGRRGWGGSILLGPVMVFKGHSWSIRRASLPGSGLWWCLSCCFSNCEMTAWWQGCWVLEKRSWSLGHWLQWLSPVSDWGLKSSKLHCQTPSHIYLITTLTAFYIWASLSVKFGLPRWC